MKQSLHTELDRSRWNGIDTIKIQRTVINGIHAKARYFHATESSGVFSIILLISYFAKVNQGQNNRSNVELFSERELEKMNLTVKTLKGGKFVVECEPSQTVLDVKAIIVSSVPSHAFEDKAFRMSPLDFVFILSTEL